MRDFDDVMMTPQTNDVTDEHHVILYSGLIKNHQFEIIFVLTKFSRLLIPSILKPVGILEFSYPLKSPFIDMWRMD